MEKGTNICQSCGMPMERDEHFGTNEDGSKNQDYCTYCYREGGFTDPDLSIDGMIRRIASITGQTLAPEDEKRSRQFLSSLKRWSR
jgi:hypothetical protein